MCRGLISQLCKQGHPQAVQGLGLGCIFLGPRTPFVVGTPGASLSVSGGLGKAQLAARSPQPSSGAWSPGDSLQVQQELQQLAVPSIPHSSPGTGGASPGSQAGPCFPPAADSPTPLSPEGSWPAGRGWGQTRGEAMVLPLPPGSLPRAAGPTLVRAVARAQQVDMWILAGVWGCGPCRDSVLRSSFWDTQFPAWSRAACRL